MERIVVGVDGSEHARRALAFAVDEARRHGARIDAVMAFPTPVPYGPIEFAAVAMPTREEVRAEAERTLEQELSHVDNADVEIESIVIEGPAARSLIETAAGADLLVVGSRGRGGFRGLLLGSVSHQLVTHAPCPVVVVPVGAP